MGETLGRILVFAGLVFVGLSFRRRTEATRQRRRSLVVRELGVRNRSGRTGVVFEEIPRRLAKPAIDRVRNKRSPVALTVVPYANRPPGPGLANTQPSCACE